MATPTLQTLSPLTPAELVQVQKPRTLDFKPVPDGLTEICKTLIYRQSMLKDYIACPQRALYGAVLRLEQEKQMFAAVAGTAGHKVMYQLHEERVKEAKYIQVVGMFTDAFQRELKVVEHLPAVGVHYETLQEQLEDVAPKFAAKIINYYSQPKNREFHSTLHEQSFVLQIKCEELSPTPFLFVGQIDQAGYNEEGNWILRDIKFRDKAFKPTALDLKLDYQFTIYSYALRHGVPACDACKPRYDQDFTVVYTGPCVRCKAKIGTPQWPMKLPEICTLIWMSDYVKYKKDQFKQTIKDPQKRKVKNPATGKPRIMDIVNPAWVTGWKQGDFMGPGLMDTTRPPSALNVLMSDALRVAWALRQGIFFRNPDKSRCNQWCSYKQQCMDQYEQEAELADVSQLLESGIFDNPFGED